MKTKVLTMCVVVAMVAANAAAFDVGPPQEWNDAAGGDWKSYDKTRHVETDADTEYLEVTTIAGPTWDVGPWDCDNITMLGAAGWYNTGPGWQGHQGLVGIDNSNGSQDLSGCIQFHINNFMDQNPEKWVWDEIYYYTSANASILHALYACPPPPDGVMVTQDNKVNVYSIGGGDPGMHENLDGRIKPNPFCEEIIIDFFVPAGEEAYIDSFEVATMCIPEPATMAILTLGGLALLRRRR